MDTRRQYERVYKKNTYAIILRYQILQQKNGYENLNKSRGEMKGSFYGRGFCVDHIFEGENKVREIDMKSPLKGYGRVKNKNFMSNNCYWKKFHKRVLNHFLYLVDKFL